ncbi:MAG: ligase-associated DNA damage response endonuclease PdeM [Caulobacteraceae bacterium]|nr:ligase-associated DNA damage response endonuclease PdeM [Caulobacteraceae bacterium]
MSAAGRKLAFDLAASDCGAVRLTLAGLTARLRPAGTLWLEESRTLAAADLHLEKGSAYAARGQLLPPYDTAETLARLEQEVEALNPARIVLLGDSFHDGGAEARLAADSGARLASLARGRTLVWVVGNHDADGPRGLPGEVVAEHAVGRLVLRHEPQAGPRAEAAGHLHPAARVATRGRSVRRRCFVTDGERVVLPAFGAYAGGLNVRDKAFAGLFAGRPIAVALGPRQAHAIGWSMLVGD